MTRARGAFALVWIALCVALVAPLFVARTLPILDLPNHLALVRGWLSYHDPSYQIAEHYQLSVRPVPYLLFYAVCRGLAAWLDLELAGKLALAIYLLAFVHGALAIAIASRRSPWLALAAFPLAYGPAYAFGFVNYLYGAALLLFAIAAALQAERAATLRARLGWLALTSLLAILVLASHVLAWGYLGLGLFGLVGVAIAEARRAGRLQARDLARRLPALLAPLLATVPSLLLFVWSVVVERRDKAYFKEGGQTRLYYRPLFDLLNDLPRWILEVVPGPVDRVALLLLVLGALACFAWPAATSEREVDEDRAAIARLRGIAAAWALAYLVLPESAYAPTRIMFISHRLPMLFSLLVLLAAPRPRHVGLLAPSLVAALLLPPLLVDHYRDFSRRQEPFFSLVEQIPRGAPTLVVPRRLLGPSPGLLTPDDRAASVPVYWHFTSWPMALRGGVSPHLFDQGIPVRPRRVLWAQPESKQQRVDLRPAGIYEYFLLYEPSDPITILVDKVASAGNWTLYRRRPTP